nr:hypothetical protein [Tanacetum cinerariifolium]
MKAVTAAIAAAFDLAVVFDVQDQLLH